MNSKSLLTHLECSVCGRRLDADRAWNLCPECGKPLLARYDLEAAARSLECGALAGREPSLWRYHELLPVRDHAFRVTLGEGFTPLIHATRLGRALGCSRLFIKEEGLNPTRSFKARGLAVAVSRAHELGIGEVSIPSAGNAAGAMSAYAALAGMRAHVFMPRDVPGPFIEECRTFGAAVTLVAGVISDCARMAAEGVRKHERFDLSTLREPYRVEGKKTMGYELAEQMDWRLPDAVVYPTGGGTGLIGMWKAFDEMEALGWIGPGRPRMVAVQASGCAPMVRAFEEGAEFAARWENPHTIADGLRVPGAVGDFLILRALRESRGTAVAVTDGELMEGAGLLARREGIFACPEGGATVAGLRRLLADGWLTGSETVVLFNTGSGHKQAGLWTQPSLGGGTQR